MGHNFHLANVMQLFNFRMTLRNLHTESIPGGLEKLEVVGVAHELSGT